VETLSNDAWSNYGWKYPSIYQPTGQGQQTSQLGTQLQNYYNPTGMSPINLGGGTSQVSTGLGMYGQTGGTYTPQAFSQLYAPSYLQGQSTAGQLQIGEQNLANQLALASSKRTAVNDLVSKYSLDQPETYQVPAEKTALENELINRDWETAQRGIENDYARSGASLSSERDRALEEGRGSMLSALRSSKTLNDIQGQQAWQNMLAKILAIYGS
jgi:hypothetical protein